MNSSTRLIAALCFASLLLTRSAAGQVDSTQQKRPYFLSLHAGALMGKKNNGNSLSTSLIQGVRIKRFAIGAGVGYDAYVDWQMMPVFGSVGYDLARVRGNAFFLQVNVGYSHAWNRLGQPQQMIYRQWGTDFFHPVVGYRMASGNLRIYMEVGYKVQQLVYEQTASWWPDYKITTRRDIERLSLQIGIGMK